MNFTTMDDDERVIAETAAAFAAKRLAPTPCIGIDQALPRRRCGVRGARHRRHLLRRDVNGSLRRIDAVRIFEQRPSTISAFISIHNMCAWMIDTYGTREQRKSRWYPFGVDGLIASYCPDRTGAARMRRHAPKPFGTATTTCSTASNSSSPGRRSDVYVVMAAPAVPDPRGISTFIVETALLAEFRCQREKMGWNAQPTAQVILEGCGSADAMLGGPGRPRAAASASR